MYENIKVENGVAFATISTKEDVKSLADYAKTHGLKYYGVGTNGKWTWNSETMNIEAYKEAVAEVVTEVAKEVIEEPKVVLEEVKEEVKEEVVLKSEHEKVVKNLNEKITYVQCEKEQEELHRESLEQTIEKLQKTISALENKEFTIVDVVDFVLKDKRFTLTIKGE